MFNPEDDGITHINIYSKGKTELGRKLSNWSHTYIETSIGGFDSIEGLIFYLGSFDERLRKLSGYNAKKLGEELDRGIRLPEDVFRRLVVEAMKRKVEADNQLETFLKRSTLPLTHYYCYGGKVINISKWQWQIDEWEKIRQQYKGDN